MDSFATWMMNGGRDPFDEHDERELLHRRALREARSNAASPSRIGRLAASVRAIFRADAPARPDAACCAA
jgi:hypothetical protein